MTKYFNLILILTLTAACKPQTVVTKTLNKPAESIQPAIQQTTTVASSTTTETITPITDKYLYVLSGNSLEAIPIDPKTGDLIFGKFEKEGINVRSYNIGGIAGMVMSPDKQYLYLADLTYGRVYINKFNGVTYPQAVPTEPITYLSWVTAESTKGITVKANGLLYTWTKFNYSHEFIPNSTMTHTGKLSTYVSHPEEFTNTQSDSIMVDDVEHSYSIDSVNNKLIHSKDGVFYEQVQYDPAKYWTMKSLFIR